MKILKSLFYVFCIFLIFSASLHGEEMDTVLEGKAITHSAITNQQLVVIDDASALEGEYTRLTATGLEGRTKAEVKSDLDLDSWINVKDYGAKGDGSTDDYASITAAIAAMNALTNGGTIFFPNGVYLTSAQLTFTYTANKLINVIGYGARIEPHGAYNGSLAYFGSASPVAVYAGPYVRGLTFNNAYLPNPDVGCLVELENANGIFIKDCVFRCGTDAIDMDSSYAVRIEDCRFIYQELYAIYSSTSCHNLLVRGCLFGTVLAADIYIAGGAYNINILQNDMEGTGRALYLASLAAGITFNGNYVECSTTASPLYFGGVSDGVEIRGNWIGYNTSTQTWYNIIGGAMSGNIFWNQAQVVDGSCADFEIGHNAYNGTSNDIDNGGGSGINNVVEDVTPQLGGNLDINGFDIVSVSNNHIDLTPNGTGNIRLDTDTIELNDTGGHTLFYSGYLNASNDSIFEISGIAATGTDYNTLLVSGGTSGIGAINARFQTSGTAILSSYHDGTKGIVKTLAGNLSLEPTGDVSIISAKLILDNTGDPTSATHVGDRGYNDTRYAELASAQTINANWKFNDSKYLLFGSSAVFGSTDAWAYFNGATDDLYIQNYGDDIYVMADNEFHVMVARTEYAFRGVANAGAYAYYDNAIKFQTTNIGVTVTGTVTATCGVLTCNDYVFEPDYALMSLDKLNAHVKEKKHLPDMTINNLQDGKLDYTKGIIELLVKTEEQALYILQLHERVKTVEIITFFFMLLLIAELIYRSRKGNKNGNYQNQRPISD